MGESEKVFQRLSKLFKTKIKNMDLKAVRKCLLDAHNLVGKLNLDRPFSKTSSSFLHTAVWYRHVELVKWLLAWGADPNVQNLMGVTPVHFLAEKIAKSDESNRIILQMLVKAGGDVKRENKDGKTALDIMKKHKKGDQGREYLRGIERIPGVAEVWRTQIIGYYVGASHDESSSLAVSEISDVMSNSATPESSTLDAEDDSKEGRAKRAYLTLVKMLALEKGDVDEEKFTQIIRDNRDLIISEDLDLNAVTKGTGASLLHACVWYSKLDCVKALVEIGQADVMIKNAKGATPLHLAAQRGHKENVKAIIDVLMIAGASKVNKNKKGKVPPDEAKINHIREYILNWPAGSKYEKVKKKEDEMKKAAKSNKAVPPEWEFDYGELKALFDKMDWDKNSHLNFSDVRKSLINMDHAFSNPDMDAMMKSGDPDGDGQISWDEFKDLMPNYCKIKKRMKRI